MRASKHRGWFQIFEEDIRTIEATFDGQGARRKAMAALVAVSRIANLERSNTFTRPISSIAGDMSYSYGHAAEALALLETAGLLKIKGQTVPGSKEKAPSEYTLQQIGGTVGTKKGKVASSAGNPARTENSQSLPNNIQSIDTSRNGSELQPDEEWLAMLQQSFPDKDVEGELTAFRAFCSKRGTSVNRRAFEGWMRKASPKITHPGNKQHRLKPIVSCC